MNKSFHLTILGNNKIINQKDEVLELIELLL